MCEIFRENQELAFIAYWMIKRYMNAKVFPDHSHVKKTTKKPQLFSNVLFITNYITLMHFCMVYNTVPN